MDFVIFLSLVIFLMVGVRLYFSFGDFRQKKFTVDPQKTYFKKFVDFTEPYDVWLQPKPLETLILLDMRTAAVFFTKTTSPANYLHFSVKTKNLYWFYLYLRMNSARLYSPQDLSYEPKASSVAISSSCYLTYFSLITYTNTDVIESISSIYSGFSWVERETQELFNFTVRSLVDSRRLLTDYTSGKPDHISYNTTSYDHLTQNLYNSGCFIDFISFCF